MPGAREERRVGLGQQRRRAGDEEPHVRGRLAGQARVRKQPRVEGRHAHHGGRPA